MVVLSDAWHLLYKVQLIKPYCHFLFTVYLVPGTGILGYGRLQGTMVPGYLVHTGMYVQNSYQVDQVPVLYRYQVPGTQFEQHSEYRTGTPASSYSTVSMNT